MICAAPQIIGGGYVLLPMAGYASHYKRFRQLPTSPYIIPLFVGFEMSDADCDDIVSFLREHEPIGCRDEATMLLLRSKGVEAYVSGCLTITLPKRTTEPKDGKVFFVDISSRLERYIPDFLKENCEYIHQEGYIKKRPLGEEERLEIDDYAREILTKYAQEARLVVTSRLHAAAPCLALGIPVILAIDNIDSRFSWLDKLIPLYDQEQYDRIDWNPKPVEIEHLKENIISAVTRRIRRLYEANRDIYDLSTFWEDRQRAAYNRALRHRLRYLEARFGREDVFRYVIWGAGVHGKIAYAMMSELFPRAKLIAVADNYATGKLFGCDIIKPTTVADLEFEYALLTSHPGRFEAVAILESMHKRQNEEWCYFISKDIPEACDPPSGGMDEVLRMEP